MKRIIESIEEFAKKQEEACRYCDECDSHTIGVCLRKFTVKCTCGTVASIHGEEVPNFFKYGCSSCYYKEQFGISASL